MVAGGWAQVPADAYLQANYREAPLDVDVDILKDIKAMLRMLPPPSMRGGRPVVADVGTGPSLHTLIAGAACGAEVHAWEPHSRMADRLDAEAATPHRFWSQLSAKAGINPRRWQPQLQQRSKVLRAGAEQMPEGRYDAATMLFVAECADGTADTARRLTHMALRSLRPGGRFLFVAAADAQPVRYGQVLLPVWSAGADEMRGIMAQSPARQWQVRHRMGQIHDGHRGLLFTVGVR